VRIALSSLQTQRAEGDQIVTDEQMNERLESWERRRLNADARNEARMSKREDEAETLIGEFNDGSCYINLRDRKGNLTGKIKRDTRSNLISYLIRNRYV
jgi:hypothetical protein